MRVLVHEPNHRGHRFTTARVLIEALLELNTDSTKINKIIFATNEEAVSSDEYTEQLQPLSKYFELYLLPKTKTSSVPAIKTHRQLMGFRRCLLDNDIDHIYLPYADYQLQLLTLYSLIPGVKWWPPKPVTESQLMQSTFAYHFAKKSKQILTMFAVKHSGSDRIHLNDQLAIDYLAKNDPATLSFVKGIPDPITATIEVDKVSARRLFDLPINSRIIGCLGVINERKGADVLLNAFLLAKLKESDILLLAGKLSPELKEQVTLSQDKRIVCLDRYLSETELSNAISAMDLVVTPYKQVVGSASIIIRAAVANRMVLSSDTGWAGAIVPKYQLGLTSSVKNIEGFSQALENAIHLSQNFQPSSKKKMFVQYNSEKNVKAHWTALIRERLHMKSVATPLHLHERQD